MKKRLLNFYTLYALKAVLVACIFGSSANTAFAQIINGLDTLYGNDWIEHSQNYFKFEVTADGIYRIPASTLNNQGISASGSQFQLFHLGKEVPLFVTTSGSFSGSDYIQFYAVKNRGEFDQHLYPESRNHTNPYYSLFSDKATYFLTWNNSSSNSRLVSQPTDLINLPPKENYYNHEALVVKNTSYSSGRKYTGNNISLSEFQEGEGYAGSYANDADFDVSTPHVYPQGGDTKVKVRVRSNGTPSVPRPHNLQLRFEGNGPFKDTSYAGYGIYTFSFTAPSSQIQGNETTINIKGNDSSSDLHAVCFISVTYPKTFDFDNASLANIHIEPSSSRKYLEIENFNFGGNNPLIYDLTNGIVLETLLTGTNAIVTLPPSSEKRNIVIFNPTSVATINTLESTTFTDFAALDHDYVIISHPDLFANGNPVQQYADFRSTTGFNPIVVSIDELYDQFGYGINRHPLSLRYFSAFINRYWTTAKYIFIIGKGKEYRLHRDDIDPDFLVPTYGWPGGDNVFTTPTGSAAPTIAVGRLAATNTQEVSAYLEKISSQESSRNLLGQTIEEKSWMKRIIHLGGGNAGLEHNSITNFLESFAQVARSPKYGAVVDSFYKNSVDPITIATSGRLDSLINDGASLITFFGHSSPNSFDYNLDRPENYLNDNRHPIIMSLGCYSGLIHGEVKNIGEEFVLLPDKGAMGFIAASGLGILTDLSAYSSNFYAHMSNDMYGEGIGELIRASVNNITPFASKSRMALIQQLTLHGDPAFTLNPLQGPDYSIQNNSATFSPSVLSTSLDSFELQLNITNLGYAIDTAFNIEIIRHLPNGNQESAIPLTRVSAPNSSRNLIFKIPIGTESIGINTFTITIDRDNEIDESPNPQAESNNTITKTIYILSDNILPVWPPEFGIVDSQPKLKASTSNGLAPITNFVFQIDTSLTFASSALETSTVNSFGGLIEWTPSTTLMDSVVYYWRVSSDSISPTNGYVWQSSSFIKLDNAPEGGWNQSHFYQFNQDRFNNIVLPESSREFEFISSVQVLKVENGFSDILDNQRISVYQNGIYTHHAWCGNEEGLFVVVFDSISADPWINPVSGQYGSTNCSGVPRRAFFFETGVPSSRQACMRFIQDSIPANNYVIVYSLNDYQPQDWEDDLPSLGYSLFDVLENEGANLIRNSLSSVGPYAFFFQKGLGTGFPELAEELGADASTIITPTFLILGNWDDGYIESTLVGPALNWQSIKWQSSTSDGLPDDSYSIDIYGVNNQNNKVLLYENLNASDTTLNFIDANSYPFLQLRYKTKDVANRTPRQLDYWRVLYQPFPEALLKANEFYSFDSDTLQQGQELKFKILSQNISVTDMDSMLVKFQITNPITGEQISSFKRFKPLLSQDTLLVDFDYNTSSLSGINQLFVELNPNDDQVEQFHFNNIAFKEFYVFGDNINPLLDVTFNGVHIMNGDIVSSNPEIEVTLKDENKFLALNDTSNFQIFIQGATIGTKRLTFNDEMIFFPADASNLSSDNKAQILIKPGNLDDGTYKLIIRASDRSGNESGAISYNTEFVVVNAPSISNVLNYPNPFTTSTRFVFTLTGSVPPEYMKIQIMTATGRIVREITMDELGPLHIGNNLTEFAWDGTDQFGDRLANGLYLYRVVVRSANKDYDKFRTNTSQYFKGGIGKMYLMR